MKKKIIFLFIGLITFSHNSHSQNWEVVYSEDFSSSINGYPNLTGVSSFYHSNCVASNYGASGANTDLCVLNPGQNYYMAFEIELSSDYEYRLIWNVKTYTNPGNNIKRFQYFLSQSLGTFDEAISEIFDVPYVPNVQNEGIDKVSDIFQGVNGIRYLEVSPTNTTIGATAQVRFDDFRLERRLISNNSCENFAGEDQTICKGEQVQIGCTNNPLFDPDDSSVQYCYYWEPNENLDNPYSVSPIANPTSSTRYTVYVTTSEGNLVSEDYVDVEVLGEDLILPPSEIEICQGESVSLVVGGGESYLWNTGSSEAEILVTPTHTTIYSVTVTNSMNCIFTQNIEVIVGDGEDKYVDLELYRPLFLNNTGGELVHETVEFTVGTSTFENNDDDDDDGELDFEDQTIEGGDDDLIRLKLKVKSSAGVTQARLNAIGNVESIKIWMSEEKENEYTPGDLISLDSQEDIWNIRDLWVEGLKGHESHREVKLKLIPEIEGLLPTFNNACNFDEVSITVMKFKKILWKGMGNGFDKFSIQSDKLDKQKGSYRVFSGKRFNEASNNLTNVKNQVEFLIKVKPSSIEESIPIFVKSIDLDDPSDDKIYVDPNDNELIGELDYLYPGTEDYYSELSMQPPTYNLHNDNRGKVNTPFGAKQYGHLIGMDENGILQISISNGTSEALGTFEVSSFPGDNYSLVTSNDYSWLEKVENVDKDDQDKIKYEGKKVNSKQISDESLTVWRILHIECDAMEDYSWNENQIEGYFSDYDGNKLKGFIPMLKDGSRDMGEIDSNDDNTGEGRFQQGVIFYHTGAYLEDNVNSLPGNSVNYNGIDWIEINSISPSFSGLPCKLKKGGNEIETTLQSFTKNTGGTNNFKWELNDDIPNLSDFIGGVIQISDDNSLEVSIANISNQNEVFTDEMKIPFVLRDDDEGPGSLLNFNMSSDFLPFDKLEQFYEDVYVLPVYDGGGDLSNNNQNVPFEASIPTFTDYQTAGEYINKFATDYQESIALEENNYWITYIVVGWQGNTKEDFDPGNSPVPSIGLDDVGTVASTPAIECSGVNIKIGAHCFLFYREVHYESFVEVEFNQARTLAHEIGHTFGLSHNSPSTNSGCVEVDPNVQANLMKGGGLSDVNTRFANFNINLIRSRITSPGQ